jgi:hypothetical protein
MIPGPVWIKAQENLTKVPEKNRGERHGECMRF